MTGVLWVNSFERAPVFVGGGSWFSKFLCMRGAQADKGHYGVQAKGRFGL